MCAGWKEEPDARGFKTHEEPDARGTKTHEEEAAWWTSSCLMMDITVTSDVNSYNECMLQSTRFQVKVARAKLQHRHTTVQNISPKYCPPYSLVNYRAHAERNCKEKMAL